MDTQIKKVLNGMGFPADTWTKAAGVLSGGEQTRLRLARLLLERPDLLILDDLGTEFDSSFYQSTIYNLINTRLNRSLPTIISTNLDFNGISNRYEERITSRIYANYSILRFVGQDVRIMKAQQAFRKEKERGNRP